MSPGRHEGAEDEHRGQLQQLRHQLPEAVERVADGRTYGGHGDATSEGGQELVGVGGDGDGVE